MKRKGWQTLARVVLLTAMFAVAQSLRAQERLSPHLQEPGPNLLVNPGFEGVGQSVHNAEPNPDNWTRDTFNGAQYGEIFTPAGWAAWWEEGEFGRPECKVIPNESPFNTPPIRIHAGYYSALCFAFYRPLHAGLYQVVRGIPPHSVVEGAFMAHAWTCGEDNPPLSCGDPNAFYFRVGIDPDGNTDPFSENVVWSEPYYNYDAFARVGPIQATVGVTGVATIFLEALGKWPNKHNDAYWDNASLRVVMTGTFPTATPPPPPPTPGPGPSVGPRVTATPLPEGTILHTVEAGDTWLGVALTYGVDLGELRRLNVGAGGDAPPVVGQTLVVRAGGGLSPGPDAAPTVNALPVADVHPQSPTGDLGVVCVLAFEDINADGIRQDAAGERVLAHGVITVVAAGAGPAAVYRTTGSEPHCFQDLPAGQAYLIHHTPPPGYVAAAGPWALHLSGGQVYQIALAYYQAPPPPRPISAFWTLGFRIGGSLILLWAAVTGGRLVLSRRA